MNTRRQKALTDTTTITLTEREIAVILLALSAACREDCRDPGFSLEGTDETAVMLRADILERATLRDKLRNA